MTPPHDASIHVEADEHGARVVLRGVWRLRSLDALRRQVDGLALPPAGAVRIDADGIEGIDTSGAWVIRRLRLRLEAAGRAPTLTIAPEYAGLVSLVEQRLGQVESAPAPERRNLLERVGRTTVAQITDLLNLLAFVGEVTVAGLRQLRAPGRIRWRMTAKIVEQSGVDALGIVGLLVFLLGIVVAYQGGRQLAIYGANIFIVELVVLIMLRELAPLIAAIIVAGRTGSAYTAEIGTMRVTEEIDAMQTIGIAPFDQLVLPKVVGLVIALPLLVVFADALGVFGGMMMARGVLEVSFIDFVQRIPQVISTSDFVVGVVKAPVFALIIAMVGCYQGFQVRGGADSVGKQTTVSVVQSIFLVIVTDAVFSVLFSWMGV
jgi:phospholipid/cholesterol/gamma-HCH transport system permease protein